MREIRLHARFGQPLAKVAAAVAKYAQAQGQHVQVFNSFAAFRPGGPNFAVVRADAAPVRLRSANSTSPDVVVVLDNSLFASVDVTKGLKSGGTVMALGVDSAVLGDKAKDYAFVDLAAYIKGEAMADVESGLVAALAQAAAF